MNWLTETFCEDPTYVYILLAIMELVLVAIWYESRNRKLLWMLIAPVAIAAAVAVLDWAVVTDREQIVNDARTIARDLEQGQVDAVVTYLDDKMASSWGSREAAVSAGREVIKSFGISSIGLGQREIVVQGKSATLRVVTPISFRSPLGQKVGTISLVWNVQWVKRPQGWRICQIDQPREGISLR